MLSQDLDAIGEEVRVLRKLRGLTQAEAAEEIQAHRNEISRIENGKYSGNLATFIRYLNLLGLTLYTRKSRYPVFEELDALFNQEDE